MGVLLDRPFGASAGNPSGLSTLAQNTQGAQVEGVLPATQSITSSAETLIVNPLNTSLTLTVNLPPKVGLEQKCFDLVASGLITVGVVSNNITLNLYAGSAIVSGNLLKSSGTIAQAVGSGKVTAAFWVKGKLIYDSTSGILAGTVEFYINKTVVAAATLANFVTGVNDANDPVLTFCLTVTSSGATVANPTSITVQAFCAG